MNHHIVSFINTKIEAAARFVCHYMPVGLTSPEVYAGLIETLSGGEVILEAFRNAAKYLPPEAMQKRVNLAIDGIVVSATLRLFSTPEYPQYLLPHAPLFVTQESKLGAALRVPIHVARQWQMLQMTWEHMHRHEQSGVVLMYLFPWLREIVAEFNDASVVPNLLKKERSVLQAELKKLRDEHVLNLFPRLTPEVNEVCKSGRALFSQFRMLEATYDGNPKSQETPPVGIERTPSLVPKEYVQSLSDVTLEWGQTKAEYAKRAWDKSIERANKKFEIQQVR